MMDLQKKITVRKKLTAEFTAAFLCAFCGIEQQIIKNSTAYIQGWLKELKNDKRLILKAATQAQASADYIINNTTENVTVGIEETSFIN